MATGRAIFRVQQAGAPRAARDLKSAAREMRKIMLAEMRANRDDLKAPFVHAAPYDTQERDDYHLQENIEVAISTAGRIRATVRARAVDPSNGFDYLDVTRYGRGAIYPTNKRVLRWVTAEGPQFARYVGPWSPGGDWVEEAQPEADRVAAEIADRVGRVVYTRLLA